MKKAKKYFVLIIVFCMIISTLPTAFAGDADTLTAETVLTGNSGAVITANKTVRAYTEDTDLVRLFVSDGTVTVKAKSDAVGIATVVIYDNTTEKKIEIPVGYTTFFFNDDSLTVFSGSSSTYEVLGINTAGEEYTPESSLDAEGNAVYTNTDTYSLDVEVKKKGGTFVFYGSSDDMSIAVKKEATGEANLIFAGLTLSSTFTSPITIKKNSTSTVKLNVLSGFENTFSDVDFNNADIYGDTADGGDGTNVNYAESAVIKGKAYADLTICGAGTLNLICNSKNAVKIGEYGALTIEDVTLNITSTGHGISSDNTITVNSGTINITSAEDGIRTNPDAVDSTAGTSAVITINKGNITVNSGSDAIQSAQDITINGGTFNIKTGDGYNDSDFDEDNESCKGIKASSNSDESTDTSTATNTITVAGGTFTFNCADDAIHSDAYVNLTGGKFTIQTGDDGVHADTLLNIGEESGDNCALLINVTNCYEGLESGTVNIYSGVISVVASDDGINSAGGSDSSDNPGQGSFNPGGGRFNPGGGMFNPGGGSSQTETTAEYAINIYGGDIYVNVSGDGLDSNGALTLSGGYIVVWGQSAGGDNEPLDCDGTLTINGATVFAAGSSAMTTTPKNSQKYITSKSSISSGKTVKVVYNNSSVYETSAIKAINYVLYSSPTMTSTSGWSITSSTTSASEPTVTAIELYTEPETVSYITGDTFTTDGLSLKVTYSDGRTLLVEDGFTVSGADMSTEGSKTITVSYGGYSTTYDITVTENTRLTETSFTVNDTLGIETLNNINYIYGLDYLLTTSNFENEFTDLENITFSYETNGNYLGTGSVVYVKSASDGAVIATYEIVVYGDVDGDGVTDVLDASMTEKMCNGITEPTQSQIFAANGTTDDTLSAGAYQNVVNLSLKN